MAIERDFFREVMGHFISGVTCMIQSCTSWDGGGTPSDSQPCLLSLQLRQSLLVSCIDIMAKQDKDELLQAGRFLHIGPSLSRMPPLHFLPDGLPILRHSPIVRGPPAKTCEFIVDSLLWQFMRNQWNIKGTRNYCDPGLIDYSCVILKWPIVC